LPRLDLIQRAGFALGAIDQFVLNHHDLPFQRETLATLGVPWHKVVRADSRVHLELEEALVTRSDEHMYALPSSTAAFLNRQAPSPIGPQRTRRLFVTRRNAAFRRILNEDAIIEL